MRQVSDSRLYIISQDTLKNKEDPSRTKITVRGRVVKNPLNYLAHFSRRHSSPMELQRNESVSKYICRTGGNPREQ